MISNIWHVSDLWSWPCLYVMLMRIDPMWNPSWGASCGLSTNACLLWRTRLCGAKICWVSRGTCHSCNVLVSALKGALVCDHMCYILAAIWCITYGAHLMYIKWASCVHVVVMWASSLIAHHCCIVCWVNIPLVSLWHVGDCSWVRHLWHPVVSMLCTHGNVYYWVCYVLHNVAS